jgi:hypothetical protein
MAFVERFTCDSCGATKGPENHWFLIRLTDSLQIMVWSVLGAKKHVSLCGEACVIKWVSQHLTQLNPLVRSIE